MSLIVVVGWFWWVGASTPSPKPRLTFAGAGKPGRRTFGISTIFLSKDIWGLFEERNLRKIPSLTCHKVNNFTAAWELCILSLHLRNLPPPILRIWTSMRSPRLKRGQVRTTSTFLLMRTVTEWDLGHKRRLLQKLGFAFFLFGLINNGELLSIPSFWDFLTCICSSLCDYSVSCARSCTSFHTQGDHCFL